MYILFMLEINLFFIFFVSFSFSIMHRKESTETLRSFKKLELAFPVEVGNFFPFLYVYMISNSVLPTTVRTLHMEINKNKISFLEE